MSDSNDFFQKVFLDYPMYVGLLVASVIWIILLLTGVLTMSKSCAKKFPLQCSENTPLIPEGGSCVGSLKDFCEGGTECSSSTGAEGAKCEKLLK
jgi:hypothetical protein